MLKFTTVLCCLLGLLSLKSFSQNTDNYTVIGAVVDSLTAVPVEFATAKVMDKSTFQLVKAVAADQTGAFSITLNKSGNFMLVLEFIGKKTQMVNFSLTENQRLVNLGKIAMLDESRQLAEVQIVASKPLVKMDIDKIIYDMEADPEAATNNALDMLRKVPMVTVDGEEKIQLKGSANFKIYLNGKPSTMISNNPSDVLKSMPASSIKNIEVITEPGAKYDADGVGGIINIVTSSAFAGYTGSVNVQVDSRGGFGGGGFFSTKIGKFGVTANLFARNGKNGERISESSQEILDNMDISSSYRFMNQRSTSEATNQMFFGNVELSYEIDSLNLISVSGGGMRGNFAQKNSLGNTFMIGNQKDTVSGYQTLGNNFGTFGGINANANWQHSFRKPDQLFTLSYMYSTSPNDMENESQIRYLTQYPTTFNPAESHRKLSTDGSSDEHTFQADYVEPFAKKHVIESGIKYILRLNNSDNNYLMRDTLTGNFIPDNLQADNDLNYTQHILGAYGSYTFKLEKFSIRAGARFERTASEISYPNSPARNFTAKPFANLIPSVIVSYKPSMASSLRLSYTQSISRPGISMLNPFIDDSNPFQIQRGNENLDAEINNSFSLNYSMFSPKLNFNANVFSSFTNNSIQEVTSMQQRADRKIVVVTTYENIGKNNRTGGNLFVNWSPLFFLRIYANGNLNYSYYYYQYTNGSGNLKEQENDGLSFGFSGGGQLTLPLDFMLNVNGGYFSPNVGLETKMSTFYFHGISLGKSFFKKKLNVNLRVQEPLRKNRVMDFETYKEGVYRTTSHSISPARMLSVNVSYRFGEMKEQIKKVQRGIENNDVKNSESNTTGAGETSGSGTTTVGQ